MATQESSSLTTQTETVTEVTEPEQSTSPRLRLKLKKPKNDKKVKWTSGTVDNEHMGKKKSKCCCIYEKPRMFGDSSDDDDDDDCSHCRGHKDKCYRAGPDGHDQDGEQPGTSSGS